MGIVEKCPECGDLAYFPNHTEYCLPKQKEEQEQDPQYLEWKEVVFRQEQAYY